MRLSRKIGTAISFMVGFSFCTVTLADNNKTNCEENERIDAPFNNDQTPTCWLDKEKKCLGLITKPKKFAAQFNRDQRALRESYIRREAFLNSLTSNSSVIDFWHALPTPKQINKWQSFVKGSCDGSMDSSLTVSAAKRCFALRDVTRVAEITRYMINIFHTHDHTSYCETPLVELPHFSYIVPSDIVPSDKNCDTPQNSKTQGLCGIADVKNFVTASIRVLNSNGCELSPELPRALPRDIHLSGDVKSASIFITPISMFDQISANPHSSISTKREISEGVLKIEFTGHSESIRSARVKLPNQPPIRIQSNVVKPKGIHKDNKDKDKDKDKLSLGE